MYYFGSQVTEEIDETRFNTAISAMMEFVNAAYKVNANFSKQKKKRKKINQTQNK
jgi:leucyl-tRNA synthetase